jgi:hypothetical protein
MLAQASGLGKTLLVVPRLVFLAPFSLVSLGLRELLLHPASVLRGFARRMLSGNRPATCRHERDDHQRHDDQRKDEPRDHGGRDYLAQQASQESFQVAGPVRLLPQQPRRVQLLRRDHRPTSGSSFGLSRLVDGQWQERTIVARSRNHLGGHSGHWLSPASRLRRLKRSESIAGC